MEATDTIPALYARACEVRPELMGNVALRYSDIHGWLGPYKGERTDDEAMMLIDAACVRWLPFCYHSSTSDTEYFVFRVAGPCEDDALLGSGPTLTHALLAAVIGDKQ